MLRNPETPMELLNEPQVIPILIYLSENGTCNKCDIYNSISRGTNVSKRLELMQEAGLIIIDSATNGRTIRLSLTEKGTEVAEKLKDIEEIMLS